MIPYTPREEFVLRARAAGLTLKQTAQRLDISVTRVGALQRQALAKQAKNNASAERKARNDAIARRLFELWMSGQIGF